MVVPPDSLLEAHAPEQLAQPVEGDVRIASLRQDVPEKLEGGVQLWT